MIFKPVTNPETVSPLQHANAAVLFAAGEIVYLPLQRPHLDATDHADQVKPAVGEGVFALHGEGLCIDALGDNPFFLELLETLGKDLLGDVTE